MCEWVNEYIIQISLYLAVGSERIAHLALHGVIVEWCGRGAKDVNPGVGGVGIDITHSSRDLNL